MQSEIVSCLARDEAATGHRHQASPTSGNSRYRMRTAVLVRVDSTRNGGYDALQSVAGSALSMPDGRHESRDRN